MDLQMPEMDGYQATARIRSDARFARLPIVAMTAHATMEERQRCLDAGMNDHVSKPIEPEILFGTVVRWAKPAAPGAAAPAAGPAATAPPAVPRAAAAAPPPPDPGLTPIDGVDTADGLARVAGNARLYRSLLAQFADKQGGAGGAVASALERGDREAAALAAHTVKGVAGNLGMRRLHASAEALERALRGGDAVPEEAAGEFSSLLARQVEAVRRALEAESRPAEAAPARSPAAFDVRAARSAIDRLRSLLAASDGEAGSAFADLSGALAGAVGRPRLDDLERSIDEFDFDGALSKLDAIARECGAS